MKAEAVPLGERLIEQEADLDRLFASRTVQPASLGAATAAIGDTQGQLRAAHLRYHLAMMDVLTPEQGPTHYGDLPEHILELSREITDKAAPALSEPGRLDALIATVDSASKDA
jgi:hypothetical protein